MRGCGKEKNERKKEKEYTTQGMVEGWVRGVFVC